MLETTKMKKKKKKKKLFGPQVFFFFLISGPQFLETKIPLRVQGRDCLTLVGQTSGWALNNNGPILIRDVKCNDEWPFSKLLD